MRTVAINVQPSPYHAYIEDGLVHRIGEQIRKLLPAATTRVFVVTNPVVRNAWGAALQQSCQSAGIRCEFLDVPDGERHKTIATVEDLAERMLELGADRNATVIAFGGGVVGDLAGFLASVYMRGVEFVQVPTTLLAQVDAAIGGKTGVNLAAGKNLLGTFHHPRAVLTDPGVLATLPEREYRSGLYEALKCGIIRAPKIFEFMEESRERILHRDREALEWLIAESVAVKAEVVAADEREAGLRRILNFGHTIGHALEAETRYKYFLHGEAVAWGMVAAAMIAAAMQKSDPETAQRIISAVLAYAALPKVSIRGKNIVKRLTRDKKSLNGVAHFVLPVEIGKVAIVHDVPETLVLRAIDEVRYLSK